MTVGGPAGLDNNPTTGNIDTEMSAVGVPVIVQPAIKMELGREGSITW